MVRSNLTYTGVCTALSFGGDEATYIDMLFNRCTKNDIYVHQLASIVTSKMDLDVSASFTHSVEYGTFPCLYDILHLLKSLDYWHEETMFEQCFEVWAGFKSSLIGIVLILSEIGPIKVKKRWCNLHCCGRFTKEIAYIFCRRRWFLLTTSHWLFGLSDMV